MADNEHTTVRIVDIARMAGVSVATVDRVIHNRGKVSEENLARINEVLHEVNYRPNLIARSLASGRQYTLAVVMPRFAQGGYPVLVGASRKRFVKALGGDVDADSADIAAICAAVGAWAVRVHDVAATVAAIARKENDVE